MFVVKKKHKNDRNSPQQNTHQCDTVCDCHKSKLQTSPALRLERTNKRVSVLCVSRPEPAPLARVRCDFYNVQRFIGWSKNLLPISVCDHPVVCGVVECLFLFSGKSPVTEPPELAERNSGPKGKRSTLLSWSLRNAVPFLLKINV